MTCGKCGKRQVQARGLCHTCYQSRRNADRAEGTWRTAQLVDSAPVVEHMEQLRAAGVSLRQLVRLTGLHHTTVYRIAAGGQCYAHTARQVLAVPVPTVPLAVVDDTALVPSTGTTRRLQALAALGWPMAALAARLDVHTSHLCEVSRGECPRVKATMARKVAKAYDQLSGTPGPSRRTMLLSRKRGWVTPLCWDCDCAEECQCPSRIDDAAARPTGVLPLRQRRKGFTREVYDEMRRLGYHDSRIAKHMGITEKSLARQLTPSRAGTREVQAS